MNEELNRMIEKDRKANLLSQVLNNISRGLTVLGIACVIVGFKMVKIAIWGRE